MKEETERQFKHHNNMENPTYLGDAVYGFFDGNGIELRLNDHRNERAVYLEPEVIAALNRFFERATTPDSEIANPSLSAVMRELHASCEDLKARRAGLIALFPKLNALKLPISGYENRIDFDDLSHEDVIRVLSTFGGKWTKTPADGEPKIHYVRDEPINGLTIRCWSGTPPPNCQIVEEEVEVPEEVVPAHTKLVRKLVCA